MARAIELMDSVKSYKMVAPGYRQRMRYVLRMLDPRPGELVLEVGCGRGEYSTIVGKAGASLVSVDIERDGIRAAKERMVDSDVSFVIVDAQDLPFREGVFDKAFSTEVLEHIENDRKAMGSISKSLKPGGECIIEVPEEEVPFFRDPINFVLRRLGRRQVKLGGRAWGHHRHYTRKSIGRLVNGSGLRVTKNITIEHGIVSLAHFYFPEIYTFIIRPVLKKGKPARQCIKGAKKPIAAGSMYRTLIRLSDFICRMDEKLIGPGSGICVKAVKE